MTLVVENKNITESFIPYLKTRMLRHICLIMDEDKLNRFDEYFQSKELMIGNKNLDIIDSKNVIMLAMTNLQHKKYEENTHIFINPNITYPGTSIKIVDLCKIINFGTLSIEGYPIFTMTFDHFSRNIKKYVEKCAMGLG